MVNRDSHDNREESAETEQITIAPMIGESNDGGDHEKSNDVLPRTSLKPKKKPDKAVVSLSKTRKLVASPSETKMTPKLRTPRGDPSTLHLQILMVFPL